MTLHETLSNAARQFPERPWLHYEGRCWTYAEADALTDRIAAGLAGVGVRRGDRVALLFHNCPEVVLCYFACFKLGAVAVPVNTRFQPPEIAYVLTHSGSRVLIGQHDLCSAMLPFRADVGHLAHVFVAGAAEPVEGTIPFSDLCQENIAPAALPEIGDEQLAALLYTSGTTARPKGVMHSHATLRRLGDNLVAASGAETFAVTLIAAPLCHIVGFGIQMLTVTQVGGAIWIMPRFDPPEVLRLLQQSRATYYFLLPVHANLLVNCPGAEGFDLSALRVCGAGGDCVPLALQSRFEQIFGVAIDEGCGMTEIIYTFNAPARRRAGSIGKPFGDVKVRLEDPTGREVAPGETGEIVAYSGAVALGYWNDPEATAAAIRNGGMRSGDLARQDEDGYFWFVGRAKDIIIRGGSNISPGEVEDALYTHPAVYEAGVIGLPDATWGQTVRAYVALKPGAEATEAELRAHVGARLAHYKVPEQVVFTDALPKGPTGKIHRKTLRDRAVPC